MRWQKLPLRAIFKRRNEIGQPELPMLSVYRELGVVPRAGRVDNYNRPGDDLNMYRVVHPGDLVMNKMKTWQGSLGISSYEGIVSPAYFVAEASSDYDSQFLHHLLRSRPLVAQYAARSKGIRPSQWDLPWDEFASIYVSIPSRELQARIAILLDSELARIDALISKKRRLMVVITEKLKANMSSLTKALPSAHSTHSPGWRVMRLRRCLDEIDYGTGEASKPSGHVAVLGMGNIDDSGQVVGEPGGYLEAVDERLLLRTGDLLFNRTNSLAKVGKLGLIRELNEPTTFASYLVRFRASPLASTGYLNYALNTTEILELARSMALPSIGQANLNPARYSELQIALPPREEQRRIVALLDAEYSRVNSLTDALIRQVALLNEHRHALIAAAVTGEMEIPGVRR